MKYGWDILFTGVAHPYFHTLILRVGQFCVAITGGTRERKNTGGRKERKTGGTAFGRNYGWEKMFTNCSQIIYMEFIK